MINTFANLYEPSGITQLADGKILIVEDDGENPISLLQLSDKKPYDRLKKIKGLKLPSIKISDLEAICTDHKNHTFAITSHSFNAKGKYNKNRNRLIHFTVKNQQINKIEIIENLREWIVSSYPLLKKPAKFKKVQKQGGLNIEGLAFDKKQHQLLIGLRSPLTKQGRSIIIPIDLNKQTFKNKTFKGKIHKLIALDLDGAGIRDMAFIKHLNAFLILSGTSSSSIGKKSAGLWLYKRGKKPIKVFIKGIKGSKKLGTAEGITPIKLSNKDQGIMIVIDDGEQKHKLKGHYLFVPYDKLIIKQ